MTRPDQNSVCRMIRRLFPNSPVRHKVFIHTDTTDFFQVDYDDVVVLGRKVYLILMREGFDRKALDLKTTLCYRPSIAECILMDQERLGCSTVVVGRQGISRREEFLFGSVSSKIVSLARNCTVWVVE